MCKAVTLTFSLFSLAQADRWCYLGLGEASIMLLTDTLHINRPHNREKLTRAMCLRAHLSLSRSHRPSQQVCRTFYFRECNSCWTVTGQHKLLDKTTLSQTATCDKNEAQTETRTFVSSLKGYFTILLLTLMSSQNLYWLSSAEHNMWR